MIIFFKQKTAYEMRISDWSSDVCSSDLLRQHPDIAFEVDGGEGAIRWSVIIRGTGEQVATDDEIRRSGALRLQTDIPSVKPFVIRLSPTVISGRRFHTDATPPLPAPGWAPVPEPEIGRASCRERVCQDV